MEDLGLLLQLTGIGMGMTFLALGALVVGMIVMTRIIKEKPAPVVPEPDIIDAQVPYIATDTTSKARAAAAAVAVAMAQSKAKQRAAAAAVAVALAEQQTTGDTYTPNSGWGTIIRSRQVTQRDRFASQRRMRKV